jgi:hypothetical protein
MQEELKNPKIFEYYLNAFLPSGRSVTNLLEKEFSKNDAVMDFHRRKMKEWHKDKVMRLLYELRSVSLKERTPPTRKTVAKSLIERFSIVDNPKVIKTSPNGRQETRGYDEKPPASLKGIPTVVPQPSRTDGVVAYAFEDVPEWFDLNRDVIKLCDQ